MAERIEKARTPSRRGQSAEAPHPEVDWEEHSRGRFRAEAAAVARLQHPNIVQVYDFGEQCGLLYLSMEFMEGGELTRQVAGGPLASHDAARLLRTLAQAVYYAHEQGIIHRDLKPSNILLTREGVAKIADFGMAKWLSAPPEPEGLVMGTPSYMSPEQAAGKESHVAPTTDVYCLGGILYELLTGGHPPFKGTSVFDTLQQVLTREPTPPSQFVPTLPRDLEAVCLRCLRKDPGQRYSSALALAEDLERFLAGQPVNARPVGLGGRVYRWCRRLLAGTRQGPM